MGLTVRELSSNSPRGGVNLLRRLAADAAFEDQPFEDQPSEDQPSEDQPSEDQQRREAVPWYALTVKHQHERTIEAALVERGFAAFSPMYRTRRQWSDRTKEIELPLFAGYVFCRFPYEAKIRVLNTPAIWRMVEFGGRPAAIADEEIEALRTIVASRVRVRPWPRLKTGDRVRIERGPLRGVEGVLIREKDTLELVVGVELLQRSVAVQIDAAAVTPVTNGEAHR